MTEAGGSRELIQKASEQSLGLGLFIKFLVGMDREAVSAAFGSLIAGTDTTSDQIEFIGLIAEELTANSAMEARRLYESPFLDISPQGPDDLFPSATVDRLVQMLDEIKQRARA